MSTRVLLLALFLPSIAVAGASKGAPAPLGPALFAAAPPRALSVVALLKLKRRIEVARTPDARRDLQLRLAQHYHAKANAARRAQRKKVERAALRDGVKAYQAVLAAGQGSSPQAYRRRDQALFGLGDLLQRAGRVPEARLSFMSLIRTYPQSRFIPDVYLSFAEHYAHLGKLAPARQLYQRAARYAKASTAGYARYRLGWCWLSLGNHRRALEAFVRLLRGASRLTCSAQARAALLEATRRGTISAYAAIGAASKAWPFFRRVGGKEAKTMLRQLQALYTAAGKRGEAAIIAGQLQRAP